MNKYKIKIQLWADQIKDVQLQQAVFHIINTTPEAFWTCPASSSGKYHPPDERGKYGMLRHVLRMCSMTEQAARWTHQATGLDNQITKDWWIAASIIHDAYTTTDKANHATRAKNELEKHLKQDTETYKILLEAIELHMGPWSSFYYIHQHPFSWLFHMADFWLTRENVDTKF